MKNVIIVILLLIIVAGAAYMFGLKNNSSLSEKADSVTVANNQNAENKPMSVENAKLISESVSQTKAMLPIKIDENTIFSDIEGGNNEITYFYTINMNLATLPSEKIQMLKQNISKALCPQMVPVICATANEAYMKKGIRINAKFNDNTGIPFAQCSYASADCTNK